MNSVVTPLSKAGRAAYRVPKIDRRSKLEPREFMESYLRPRRPVILTDVAADWPAYGRFTPNYFRERHGDKRITVEGREWRLGRLLDTLATTTPDKPGPYPCKFSVVPDFPELLPDVMPRFAHSLPDRQTSKLLPERVFTGVANLEIFFGGPGGPFPYLHYDVLKLHAWVTQLYGRKAFTFYAPDQEHLLYVDPDEPGHSMVENHHDPDYQRYPLFKQAVSRTVVVEPGETLFLPCGWWHTARSLEKTISIEFDQLESGNWRDFTREFALLHRNRPVLTAAARAWLALAGLILGLGETLGGYRNTRWTTR